jgi:hypothetical protein
MKINKLTFIEKEKKYRGYSDNKQMWLNQYLKIQKSLSVDFRSTPPLFFFFPPRFYMTIIVPTDTTQASHRKS